jgi:hypothetical protein
MLTWEQDILLFIVYSLASVLNLPYSHKNQAQSLLNGIRCPISHASFLPDS